MLFCPSVTQSERFILISSSPHFDELHTQQRDSHDKLHAHVIGKRDRERVQVRCSDLVGSDLPHLLIDVRQIAASVKVPGLCHEPHVES